MKLYFDAETIPDQREGAFETYLDKVKPPANYKKQESIDKWMADNAEAAAAELYAKTSFSGLHGELCAIGFKVDDNPAVSLVRGEDFETEREMIGAFFTDVKACARSGEGNYQHIEWIGHNVIDFDLRFLKQRTLINRIPHDERPWIPADARHSKGVFDTMREWAGWKGTVSQDALCEAFGLPTKPGMTGADVWPAYQAGEYERIREYNLYDVETVYALHQIMTGAEK